MKQFLILLVALFLMGCGDDPRDNMAGSEPVTNHPDGYTGGYHGGDGNGGYYDGQYGGYYGGGYYDGFYHDVYSERNEYVFYRPQGSTYLPPRKIWLNFDYTGINFSVITGNISGSKRIEVLFYDVDDSYLGIRYVEMASHQNFTTSFYLGRRPAYAVINSLSFSGSITIRLQSRS